MELRHLRYFVSVAEQGGFLKAAGQLRVAQSALSKQIRDLEREVGVALFERLSRGVRLTAAGEVFLAEARATLERAAGAVPGAARARAGAGAGARGVDRFGQRAPRGGRRVGARERRQRRPLPRLNDRRVSAVPRGPHSRLAGAGVAARDPGSARSPARGAGADGLSRITPPL